MALTFFFPVGLPGAGKTTYLKKSTADNLSWTLSSYFDGDTGFTSISELTDALTEKFNVKRPMNSTEIINVDGLFLTDNIHEQIITELDEKIPQSTAKFIVFEGDIETLLYNDAKRVKSGEREKSAKATIKNLKVETQYIKDMNLIYEKVQVRKFNYLGDLANSLECSQTITSGRWCTGGTVGTCWDENGPTEAWRDEPLEINRNDFSEFYHVLNQLYPNRTSEEVDIISYEYEEYIEIDSDYDSDYYGGQTSHDFYTIDRDYLLEIFHKIKYGIERKDYNSDYIEENFPEIFV